ncbi:hypothetical protein CCMA1212_006345 [Trichoderma ghanense]|uniref:AAA+ ATPase domain-containing protein n=1 Tax=Trichoderma ghanense TaxID=65468 RepID=A0ABY2H2A3_9HYPO
MNTSVSQDKAAAQQSVAQEKSTASESSLNDGFQALQTSQSPESLSDADWTVFDEEPPKPDNTERDQDAIGDTPDEAVRQLKEPQKPALTTTPHVSVLSDYELQLILLEAQNKRRLEMARQEQAKLVVPPWHEHTPMKRPPEPSPSAMMNTMQRNPTMAIRNTMNTMPSSFNPPDQTKMSQTIIMLQAQIKALQDENQLLRRQLSDAKPPNFAIFHCITGEEGEKVYLDQPRWVRCGDKFVLEACSPVQYPEAYGLYKSLHFVVYKTYSANMRGGTKKPLQQDVGSKKPGPEPDGEIIKLVSEDMMRAMEKLAGRDEALQKKFSCLVSDKEIRAPHLWWYHYRNQRNMLDGLTPSQAEAMQSLTRWLNDAYNEAHRRADGQFKRGMVSASSMSYLIHPGDVLVCGVVGGFEARLATSWLQEVAAKPINQGPDEVPPLTDDKMSKRRWEVDAWSYRYDGDFYRMTTMPAIQLDADPTRDAEISIADLDAFPLRFASQEVRDTLERRGKTFWDCRHGKYVSYSTKNKGCTPDQRYMIDDRIYHNRHPGSGLLGKIGHSEQVLRISRVKPAFINQEDAPSEPDLYLFPRTVMGYGLRQKRWEDVDVDRIREIAWNKHAFSHLGAETETQELTRAVITSHIYSQTDAGEVQSGDKGLTMLLRGEPGTGKTFTVERAAECLERPLYVVACSEVGTQPEDVEKRLEETFYLAKTWGCILLLAETEVFLEEQTLSTVAQDARVSALLRAVEGFGGVLIMESHRLQVTGEVFRSHIQLVLHYEPLTEPQRAQIWRNMFNNFKLLGKDDMDFDDIDGYVDELANWRMDGHQMQNVMTRARQLAQFQGRKMSASHLESAVRLAWFSR